MSCSELLEVFVGKSETPKRNLHKQTPPLVKDENLGTSCCETTILTTLPSGQNIQPVLAPKIISLLKADVKDNVHCRDV